MGLLQDMFGFDSYKSPIGASERALLADDKKRTAKEQAEADALKLKQAEDRKALKLRGKGMRGGGRQGLMFRGNQSGVV